MHLKLDRERVFAGVDYVSCQKSDISDAERILKRSAPRPLSCGNGLKEIHHLGLGKRKGIEAH